MIDPAREQLPGWVWVTISGLAALVLPLWLLITAATVQITPELAGFDDLIATGVDLESDVSVWWVWGVGAGRALGGMMLVLPVAAGVTGLGWALGRVLARRSLRDRVALDDALSADTVLEGVEVFVHEEASWDPRADRTATGPTLASPGARLLASFLDAGLMLALYPVLPLLVLLPLSDLEAGTGPDPTLGLVVVGISLVAVMTLAVFQWRSLASQGQTLGKRWAGIRVVRPDGSPAGFQRAVVLRLWVFGLLVGVPGVGLLLALADLVSLWASPEHRTLHDRLADTVVHDA